MSTQPNPLDPLSAAIADRVWELLKERIAETQQAQLISIKAAADRLGIGRTKLSDMIASGEFPRKAMRNVGRRVLVVVAEMERWVGAR